MYLDQQQIDDIRLPRWSELPDLNLYADQTLDFINQHLSFINKVTDKELLTKTMINNYVKVKVVNPPINKRYTKKHLAYLVVVCILKQAFSIQEIADLIEYQIKTVPVDKAYNYFCEEFELIIKSIFNNQDIKHTPSSNIEASLHVQNVIYAVVYKLEIQNFIQTKPTSSV